ncbi:unnamed protein product [Closterium sp. NIES-65]|nr:unnamed protein product [Closterium sp. NIES-65]
MVCPKRELPSPQELRAWFARRWSRVAGARGTTVAADPGVGSGVTEALVVEVLVLAVLRLLGLGVLLVLLEVLEVLELLGLEVLLVLALLAVLERAVLLELVLLELLELELLELELLGVLALEVLLERVLLKVLELALLELEVLLALVLPLGVLVLSLLPTVTRLLTTFVTDPCFESTAASAFVAELVDFAARCRLDYAASLVAESASVCPPSVGGECALSTDVLEDRQEEFRCFAAALPHLVSTLIAPEGDPDAPDIPTPRSYAEAIEGPYSS